MESSIWNSAPLQEPMRHLVHRDKLLPPNPSIFFLCVGMTKSSYTDAILKGIEDALTADLNITVRYRESWLERQ